MLELSTNFGSQIAGDAEKDDEEEELNAAKEDEEQEQKDGEVEEGVANRLEEGGGGGNAQENALREAEPGQIPPADSPDQDEEKLEKEENVDKNAIGSANTPLCLLEQTTVHFPNLFR